MRAADVGLPGGVQVAHDDPDVQARRTHFRYPIVADRVLGLGELPSVRLQRMLARSGPDGPECGR